jgi:hypothetical protein
LTLLPRGKLASDHNVFFSAKGDTAWWHKNQKRATTLRGWQEYSGRDKGSVWKDPGFVNPAGSRPRDFRRRADPKTLQDVAGSKDGPVCSAYVTGNEIIGLIPQDWKERREP